MARDRNERERTDDQPAALGAGGRRDPTGESTGTRERETRSGGTAVDRQSEDPHVSGVQPSHMEEKSANLRERGNLRSPPSTAAQHGNQAYQEESGRGEELERGQSAGRREARRSSHERVSPADTENVTEPSGKHTNQ